MTKKLIASLIAATALVFVANAQENSFKSRFSASADWKIAKGLHLETGYELRTKDSWNGIERHMVNVGMSYKVCKFLKVGADYDFIGHYNSASVFKPRHRFGAEVTGTVDAGNWRFSLRERLQFTHKSYGVNRYQEARNDFDLKSRAKVAYRGLKSWEPYAYVEIRNTFNAASFNASYDSASASYSDYEFLGYNDAYVNRVRGAVGVEWKINEHHGIDFKLMQDWEKDKDIDTNKEGTKLKAYAVEKSFNTILAIGYCFSF